MPPKLDAFHLPPGPLEKWRMVIYLCLNVGVDTYMAITANNKKCGNPEET